jgi:hypothetical protein
MAPPNDIAKSEPRDAAVGQRWRFDRAGRSEMFTVVALSGDAIQLAGDDGSIEYSSHGTMTTYARWVLILATGEEIFASQPTPQPRRDPPFAVADLRSAVLELLGLAWAYDRTGGVVDDHVADDVLRKLIKATQEYARDYSRRRMQQQLSESLVDSVAKIYGDMEGKSAEALKAEFTTLFEASGISIVESTLDYLSASTREDVTSATKGSKGGPMEFARVQLGAIFRLDAGSARSVARFAAEQGECGIPPALNPFAYGQGPSMSALLRYARSVIGDLAEPPTAQQS